MKLFISKKPDKRGGGANSFAWNFTRWAERNNHKIVSNIRKADRAIIIAHLGSVEEIEAARAAGCYIVHRIDEYFECNEHGYRKEKHDKICALNRHADITVFQSEFVYRNAYPVLHPRRHAIIHNGADPLSFKPQAEPGRYLGHVTWSVDQRKRLDLLHEIIRATPDEQFWLVGRHEESGLNFRLPNVVLRGVKNRRQIGQEYARMKVLLFPSEDEPCPNIPIEAITAGVPVCYNNSGGTPEIVRDSGEPLERFERLLGNLAPYRARCLNRPDLDFDAVARAYLAA